MRLLFSQQYSLIQKLFIYYSSISFFKILDDKITMLAILLNKFRKIVLFLCSILFVITFFLRPKLTQYRNDIKLKNYLHNKIIYKNLDHELATNVDNYIINPLLPACEQANTSIKKNNKLLIVGGLYLFLFLMINHFDDK